MIHDRDLLIKGLIIGSALIGYKVALLNAICKRAKDIEEENDEVPLDEEEKGVD